MDNGIVKTSRSTSDSIKSIKAYIEANLVAGDNIQIDESLDNGKKVIVISAGNKTIGYTEWGKISGNLLDQSDLQVELNKYLKPEDIALLDCGSAQG